MRLSAIQTALREELVERNPATAAERPKLPPFRPAILEPVEVARVARSFGDEQARVVFLTLVLTRLRRSELQALRWADVDLIENVLRVRDSKSEDGRRTIALAGSLAEQLWRWRRLTDYAGDGERVFVSPAGGIYRAETFKDGLTAALAAAGVTKRPRPFHDLRHTAITNDAAAGSSPIAVMTKAGHATWRRPSVTCTWPASSSTTRPTRSNGGSDFLPSFLPDLRHLRAPQMIGRRLK
jgi:integrase